MTRIEFKKMIYEASKQDTSSPKDCIHLLRLHRFIEQIFDDHEAEIKAKDERIKELEEAMKHKTCDGCKQSWKPNNQTFHKYFCEYLKIPVHGGFYCNRYEPKETL